MKQTVKLFQARKVDSEGRPLKQDGEIGSLTWAALFGEETLAGPGAPNDFSADPPRIAGREVAKEVREQPKNSNRGPEVNEYLKCAGDDRARCPQAVLW
jgi:hypothetical protein